MVKGRGDPLREFVGILIYDAPFIDTSDDPIHNPIFIEIVKLCDRVTIAVHCHVSPVAEHSRELLHIWRTFRCGSVLFRNWGQDENICSLVSSCWWNGDCNINEIGNMPNFCRGLCATALQHCFPRVPRHTIWLVKVVIIKIQSDCCSGAADLAKAWKILLLLQEVSSFWSFFC